jgi:hypothetical protein
MATCPHCGGFLHEHHRCRGRWWRRGRQATAALIGASAGALVAFWIADGPPMALILTCGLLGAVLITAFRRFAKF